MDKILRLQMPLFENTFEVLENITIEKDDLVTINVEYPDGTKLDIGTVGCVSTDTKLLQGMVITLTRASYTVTGGIKLIIGVKGNIGFGPFEDPV